MHLAQEKYFPIFAVIRCCFYSLFKVWILSEHCNLPEGILYTFDIGVDTKSISFFVPIQWGKTLYSISFNQG